MYMAEDSLNTQKIDCPLGVESQFTKMIFAENHIKYPDMQRKLVLQNSMPYGVGQRTSLLNCFTGHYLKCPDLQRELTFTTPIGGEYEVKLAKNPFCMLLHEISESAQKLACQIPSAT